MRWERLFADLEARMRAAAREEFAAEVAELAAAERATVELAARIVAHRGAHLTLRLRGGRRVAGELADGALTWCLMVEGATQTLVPATAIVAVEGLERPAAVLSEVERRLRAGHVLRELAEAGARVSVDVGDARFQGVIVGVGADHLELRGDHERLQVIALAAVVAVDSL